MKKVNKYNVLVAVLILLQLINVVNVFVNDKQGRHSDEVWAYGLANSQEGPHIFMDAQTGEMLHENQWMTGQEFKEYLTVSEEERFDYENVIENLKQDTAPPLFSMLLHTVSSIFPGAYSQWYGFAINLVAFVVTQIFMYKLLRRLTGDEKWALLGLALYGFSVGAVSTVIFIRHYMLLTMFGIMTAYFHLSVLENGKEEGKEKRIPAFCGLTVSVLGGALSHYFYIVFLAGLMLMYLIFFCLKKDAKALACYVCATAVPLLVSSLFSNAGQILGFATGIVDSITMTNSKVLEAGAFSGIMGLLSSFFNVPYDIMFDINVNIVLRCIMYDMFGISLTYHIPYWFLHLLYLGVFVFFGIIMMALLVKAKERERIQKGISPKELKGISKRLVDFLAKLYAYLAEIKNGAFFVLAIFVAAAVETYTVIGFAAPFRMDESTNRYLFIIYPVISMLVLILLKWALSKVRIKWRVISQRSARLLAMLVVGMILVTNNVGAQSIWLFPRPEKRENLEKVTKGRDCVLVLTSHWLMTCYAEYLTEADDVFVTSCAEFENYANEIESHSDDEICLIVDVDEFESLVMLDRNCNREDVTIQQVESFYLDYFEKLYSGKTIELVSRDTIFQRNVCIYLIR